MRARDPVACESSGDLFCRECAVENLITQRKEIVRMQKELDVRIQEEEEERQRLEEEAQQRAIEDFELLQMGLEIKTKEKGEALRRKVLAREGGKVVVEEETPVGGEGSGKKRKFELDEEELINIAREENRKAQKMLSDEKVCGWPQHSYYGRPNLEVTERKRRQEAPVILASEFNAIRRQNRYSTESAQITAGMSSIRNGQDSPLQFEGTGCGQLYRG